MDSDDDGFPKQGGEALDMGEDFDSEEEPDDDPRPIQKHVPQQKNQAQQQQQRKPDPKPVGGKPGQQVKGQIVENQPFDLAVDVNDSEEIESDEEDDEVNLDVNVQQKRPE